MSEGQMHLVFRVPLFSERANVVELHATQLPLTTGEYAQLVVWLEAMLKVLQGAPPPPPELIPESHP
jgi:hypothetical protein